MKNAKINEILYLRAYNKVVATCKKGNLYTEVPDMV